MLRFILPVLFLFIQTAQADISIVDVRKNIPLSDEDPSYTDFYIGAGENEGLKKNMVVMVFRSMNVRDASGAQSFGEISIPVGQVKILAVFSKISVAREYKLLPRDVNPMLEQIGLMSGDTIELKDSFVDNSVPKRKPQAVVTAPAPAPAVVVTTVTVSNISATPAPPKGAPVAKVAAPTQTTEAPSETLPLKIPNEVTKTAQDSSIPNALLEDAPVNNTETDEPNSETTLPAK